MNTDATYIKAFRSGVAMELLTANRNAFLAYHGAAVAGRVKDAQFTPAETKVEAPSAQQAWDTDPSVQAEFGGDFGLFKTFHENQHRVHGIKR